MFTQHLKKLAQPIWDAQLKHPFVEALGNGSLPKEKFRFYVIQDSLFLFELAKVFSSAPQKSADKDQKLRMESHFVLSSRYEWMFWEMAWREERWPV